LRGRRGRPVRDLPSLLRSYATVQRRVAPMLRDRQHRPARSGATEQCGGCTLCNGQVRELSHSRDRHHARDVLLRPVGGEPELPRHHRLGHALGIPSNAPPSGSFASRPFNQFHAVLLRQRRHARVRDLLDHQTRRLGDGSGLRGVGRPDRVRTQGDVGGLACRPAPAMGAQHSGPTTAAPTGARSPSGPSSPPDGPMTLATWKLSGCRCHIDEGCVVSASTLVIPQTEETTCPARLSARLEWTP
jgi:hypothetical protein